MRGRSPKTVWEYGVDMRTFFRYYRKEQLRNVPDSMDFEDIDASKVTNAQVLDVDFQSVLDYMNYLVIERHNSANTRLRKTSSLRRFYQFLTDQKGLLPKNPVGIIGITETSQNTAQISDIGTKHRFAPSR